MPLFCGVLQGSILCPLLFTLYILPLGQSLCRHDINFYCYMNGTQLYVPIKPGITNVAGVMYCHAEIKNWMLKHFLQLNDPKSEVVIITPSGSSTSCIYNLKSSLGALFNLAKSKSELILRFYPHFCQTAYICDLLTPYEP